MKTIRQIADEIGVSKQAIQKRIKSEKLSGNLQGLITKIDEVIYVSAEGETLIKKVYHDKKVADNQPTTNRQPKIRLPTTMYIP
jgi:predicted transcriptional regulator